MNKKYFADIEYSKKLVDLFPESEWWWCAGRKNEFSDYTNEFMKEPRKIDKDNLKEDLKYGWVRIPALTTDMLLERLPDRLTINRTVGLWQVEGYKTHIPEIFMAEKLPNALAKMLIWLKENS